MLAPIDTAKLSNWGDIFEPLKNLPTTTEGGKQWFVPFDWGQTSITYRTDLVDLPSARREIRQKVESRFKSRSYSSDSRDVYVDRPFDPAAPLFLIDTPANRAELLRDLKNLPAPEPFK